MSIAIALGISATAGLVCLLTARTARAFAARYQDEWLIAVREHFPDLFLFLDPVRTVQLAGIGLPILGAAIFVTTHSVAATLIAISGAALAPRAVVSVLRRRRVRRLAQQLPDALAALAAALRSGMSLTQAIALTASQQPAPLAQELALVIRKQRLGVMTDEALLELEQRVPIPEFSSFATAVRVARESGGSLSESLERLANTTRRRLTLQARIAALTSQGRLQGVVLGALPIVLMLVLQVMEPQAMRLLWATPAGLVVLGLICTLEIAGFLMIRAIVGIRV
jgi:tight adherence protein B